ncbi:MAG: hypothetical protein ACJ8LG_21610 [Massilia sp.]
MNKPMKIKIGHVDCLTPGCKTRIPVRKNEATGALSFPCIECGAPNYAKADGSAHYQGVLDRMTPLATSQNVPNPAPPVAARPKDPLFG